MYEKHRHRRGLAEVILFAFCYFIFLNFILHEDIYLYVLLEAP